MSERSDRLDELFHQALTRTKEKRAAFLAEACVGDEALYRELQSMLDALERAGEFMEVPALELAAQMARRAGSQLPAGNRLGSYQVEALLGRGGMGEVYRAVDLRLDRPVALKLLPAEVAGNPERLRRFTREAKAASILNHPNIATIYEIGEAEGWHFIAMEHVEGETLEARLQGRKAAHVLTGDFSGRRPSPDKAGPGGDSVGKLELQEILDIGIQITDALETTHAKGIIHRDIKPGNLMLTPRGQVKVLDFGLAKRLHPTGPAAGTVSKTTPGVIMGTVEYMSPEQVLGQEVDQRTDLFSLGVVLYDVTTGRLPFRGESATDTVHNILHSEPEVLAHFNSKAPAELERIVGKCLEKSRELRYQSANELRVDMKRLKRDLESGQEAAARGKVKRLQYAKVIGVVVVVLALALLSWYWLGQRRSAEPKELLTPIPLTSYPGSENCPSFSPDGNQVAFSWNGLKQNNFDIYVKQVHVEPPSPLTDDPAPDVNPAWSPDGQTIAFLRQHSPTRETLILIPQRGGSERELAELDLSRASSRPSEGPYLAWTPDSRWIVCPVPEAGNGNWTLYMFSPETGEKRKLTNPSVIEGGDTGPAVSPDGRILAFFRSEAPASAFYLLRLGKGYRPQGEPERVVSESRFGNSGAAWTPDGNEIVFSPASGLWRVAASASAKPRRLPFGLENTLAPAISRQGNRLAYVVERTDTNIWRVGLDGLDGKPGMPVPFISSTRSDAHPAFSADGKRIAFESDRSGVNEIWLSDSHGSNATQLTFFGKSGGHWCMKWSPDSQSIAWYTNVWGNDDVYVISANGGAPRRLTTDPASDQWPYWSHDGQSIYFDSNRSGTFQIWKMPTGGGTPVQITRDDVAQVPQESSDGRFVYYCIGYPAPLSVWKLSLEGGEATKVLDGVHPRALWTVARDGIYFFTAPDEKGRSDLSVYEFATGKTRRILSIEKPLYWSIAVSPDGRTILWPQIDEVGSDLMLVENFK